MANKVTEAASSAELQAIYSGHNGVTAVLLWAPWHPPSAHLTTVLDAIATEQKSVRFAKVNADVAPAVATFLGADQVPFVAFLDPRGRKVGTLAGANPPMLVEKVKAFASRAFDVASVSTVASTGAPSESSEDLQSRLKMLINYSPVMLFMKGSKAEPFCKFSKQAVALMNKHKVEYSTFDILQDDEVRQGLKDYSNWKTYPQLYVNGELVGGVDIMQEMDEDGSFKDAMPKGEETLEERLHKLINQAPVMLFMKGDPETPRCGFSGKIVGLMQEQKIDFDSFDILSDDDVRQGLKTYSNWNTYPQLYAKGKLVGGLDIVKELADEGSLREECGLEP